MEIEQHLKTMQTVIAVECGNRVNSADSTVELNVIEVNLQIFKLRYRDTVRCGDNNLTCGHSWSMA